MPEAGKNGDYLLGLESTQSAWNENMLKSSPVFGEDPVPVWEGFLKAPESICKARISGSGRKDDVDKVVERIAWVAVPRVSVG